MNLSKTQILFFTLLLCSTNYLLSQDAGFDSFITRISRHYKVDLALAPELLPALDSIRNLSTDVTSIENLLHQLLDNSDITYQIVDGNKVMLRRDVGFLEGAGLRLLKGKIIDGQDGSPLPFAAVSLMGTNHGTFTDESGYFVLSVNDTTGSLHIDYLGFNPVIVPVSSFSGNAQTIQMEVNQIPLKQVVVVIPFQPVSFDPETQSLDLRGYQLFSSDELLNGSSEQLIDHLTGYTHFSSEEGIRLRSSEEENSLILMDGLPVYDPYHYYNIFSAFNGHYFSSINLYKNNMPVEYGGRIDGLIDLNSDHKNTGSKLILDTDLLLSSITGDWSITKKIRLSAGGRISHTGMLNEALKDSSVANFTKPGHFVDDNEWTTLQQPTFDFYDINAALRAGIGDRGELMISYFRNEDKLNNTTEIAFETTFHNNEFVSVNQVVDNKDTWSNEGIDLNFQSPLSDKTTINLNGFISSFDKSSAYNSSKEEIIHHMTRMSFNSGIQNSHLNSSGIKAFISNDNGEAQGYKIGIDLQHYEIDLLAKENTLFYLIEAQQEFESTMFGEYNFTMNKFEWNLGTRMTYLNSADEVYPLPHIQLNYRFNDLWRLKSSYSKDIQPVQQLTIENRFGKEVDFLALTQPEAGIPVLKGDKYMAGAGYTSDHFNMDVELFYKKSQGIIDVRAPRPDPSFDDHTSPGEFYQLFSGDGRTTGLDLLLAYTQKNFETTLSYTLSKIAERFDRLFNGNWFSPQEDRRHQIKLSTQYKIGKFTTSTLLNYKTKALYLSFVRLDGRDGIEMADQANSFDELPPYFSLDLGLDYSFKCFQHPAQFGISLINATNHQNIKDKQHTGRLSKEGEMNGLYTTEQTELLGRTFNVHFRYLLK